MRDYTEADLAMLEHLIRWNDEQGRYIQIEVEKGQNRWIVSFLGCADESTRSLLAQFSGEDEAVLSRWANSIIHRYERRKQHQGEK